MAQHEHGQDEESFGLALGFRIIEVDGKLHLAEAEIAPYVDSPDELGVTLVFHPLDGINPVQIGEEGDWPAWPVDIDDDLTREGSASMEEQFSAIVRQLQALSTAQLEAYLKQAMEEEDEAE
jgi:hypothetical protein